MPKRECDKSPDGYHDWEAGVIEVTDGKKTVLKMVMLCFWCGKQKGR